MRGIMLAAGLFICALNVGADELTIHQGAGAELLVKAKDNDGPDEGAVWKRGDIVMVKPVDSPWARGELNRDFYIITITDVDWRDMRRTLASTEDDTLQNVQRLRLRRMQWGELSLGMQFGLSNTGRYSLTWNEMRPDIWNMRTGLPDLGGAQLTGGN